MPKQLYIPLPDGRELWQGRAPQVAQRQAGVVISLTLHGALQCVASAQLLLAALPSPPALSPSHPFT